MRTYETSDLFSRTLTLPNRQLTVLEVEILEGIFVAVNGAPINYALAPRGINVIVLNRTNGTVRESVNVSYPRIMWENFFRRMVVR